MKNVTCQPQSDNNQKKREIKRNTPIDAITYNSNLITLYIFSKKFRLIIYQDVFCTLRKTMNKAK